MTYLQALQYLNSFTNYEHKNSYPYQESFNLESVRDFLELLGNPQDSLKCLHIAGTKGKGSTCIFIANILKTAGFKVGLYTSPHLSDLRERIRILARTFPTPPSPIYGGRKEGGFEGMISQRDIAHLVAQIKPVVEKYYKNLKHRKLSFFEVFTALAFVYFKEKKTDFVVLETGLGGRLDATNVVNSLVCGITPISFDHRQFLGNTLKKIAQEKAGIIKLSSVVPAMAGRRHPSSVKKTKYERRDTFDEIRTPIVISAPQEPPARQVIRERCRRVGARLYEIRKEIKVISYQLSVIRKKYSIKNKFNVSGILGDYSGLKTRLVGRHQLVNAAVAIGMVEALSFYGVKIKRDFIKKGIYNTSWPGRCEVVEHNPIIVLDGAQNQASAKALKVAVRDNFKYKKLILVLGVSADKDIKGIVRELAPLADTIILTQADSLRAALTEDIKKIIKLPVVETKNIQEAKRKALAIASKEDLILVTGSLFVVGEMRELIKLRKV